MTDVRNIVESVLAGNLHEYRQLIQTFEADVFQMIVAALPDRNTAEDLTQEVFITAYRRLDSFNLDKPLRPWLLGIAANLVRNELRRRSRESGRLKLYSVYFESMVSESLQPNILPIVTEALTRCKAQLGKTATHAIKARYSEGLDLESVAKKLGRSVTATRQLLYRTRLALRDCIQSHLAAQGDSA